jgi:hypothetical protein
MILLICHPSWDIRRMAYDATRKIITAAPQLSEDLLLEFTNFLSVVGEKLYISKTRYNWHTMTLFNFSIAGSFKSFPSPLSTE